MFWDRGCTRSLVVRLKYWVVPEISTRVSRYNQVILLMADKTSQEITPSQDMLIPGFALKQKSAFLIPVSWEGPHFPKPLESQDPIFKLWNLFNIVSGLKISRQDPIYQKLLDPILLRFLAQTLNTHTVYCVIMYTSTVKDSLMCLLVICRWNLRYATPVIELPNLSLNPLS